MIAFLARKQPTMISMTAITDAIDLFTYSYSFTPLMYLSKYVVATAIAAHMSAEKP